MTVDGKFEHYEMVSVGYHVWGEVMLVLSLEGRYDVCRDSQVS